MKFAFRAFLIFYLTIDKKSINWKFKTRKGENLDNKSFFEDVKRETKTALSKLFCKVEEFGKVSVIKLQISNIRGQIRDNKTEIGEFVTSDIKEFSKFPEIIKIVEKISIHDKEILLKKEKIDMLRGNFNNEAKTEENENGFSK